MIASADPVPGSGVCKSELQFAFLALLPRIETHARIYFRHVKCPDRKQDCVQEVIALAWKWFVRLAERGKDASGFGSALATLAARSVRSGRRVCGQERARDVLSPVAQRRRHFCVGRLPDFGTLTNNPLMEALHDNTASPVPEQVCFRLDFPGWLRTLGPRNRRIAEDMALGFTTSELSRKYGVSPSRISQLRAEFHADWARYCGELPDEEEWPTRAAA
jgi:DNA-directed RNA polymerase specialized sigma24 family protein